MLKEIARSICGVVFPRNIYCICCGSIIDDTRSYSLCDSCIGKVNWATDRTCEKCGRILNERSFHSLCADCRDNVHYFDKGYTCSRYSLYERAIVSELKYKDKSYIGKVLGDVLADRMEAEFGPGTLSRSFDIALPVPISRKRMEVRGYNQAEVIAARFARRTGVEMRSDILIRTASTEAMKALSPGERHANIRGAFEVAKQGREIEGLRILVIDDIYTTGATVDEAAKVLKAAGAARVDVLTFAAGADAIKNC